MSNPKVVAVEPEESTSLVLAFANGERRRFDVRPYLDKGFFRELRNPAYFRRVRAVSGYVTWPHDQDFSWDTLYLESVPVNDRSETPTAPSVRSTASATAP
ncbi:MAG: DUF2442 domain-containing protein [Magnetococcales bacterium]|nr:DUF2442 domain-containing protein [Magnetococcales bacterium]MBF0115178.1 DUF2442 domain-containing protein [Magnetococcales bacterium]